MKRERNKSLLRFIPAIAIACLASSADVGTRLLEDHPIGMSTAITVAVSVGAFGIWLENRLSRIEQKLKDLPCKANGCPVTKRKRKR